ncbi:MAG TPA: type VI secretion system protein TssA [Pirellulales bacterium]|nr:type VI secretion system protein TssA [Pirellulales bacterium]
MASAPQIDIDRLLSPIAGDHPCGADLRWEPIYQEIKSARQRGDRDLLETGEEPPPVEWRRIIDLASEALAEQTKDLMIASWLVEALVNNPGPAGFAGLRDGLKVISGLLENFWEQVYPLPEDGDLETRVAPLVFITDARTGARLPNCLREVSLAAATDESYSFNYFNARKLSPKGENEDDSSYERRSAEAAERARKFDDAIAATPVDFIKRVYDDLLEATAELKRFDSLLDEKFGRLAPGTSALRQNLEEITTKVRSIVRDKGGLVETVEQPSAGDETDQGSAGQATLATTNGRITSRQEAFRRLAEVAQYLRITEPQSPVAYLIERAVAWGHMPFEQLLTELIRDEGVRGQVGELLGIRRSGETSSE